MLNRGDEFRFNNVIYEKMSNWYCLRASDEKKMTYSEIGINKDKKYYKIGSIPVELVTP